ncbi:MAG: histidine kinase [Omnitrophica WOR_2 bacterium]
MILSGSQLSFVLVYFIYGLSFFSMGIALALETGRSPLLAERRVLRPLATFGVMHGMHEWLEIILLQGVWLATPFPASLSWFRVIWLALSFSALIYFGIFSLSPKLRNHPLYWPFWVASVLLFAFVVWIFVQEQLLSQAAQVDALVRYLLGVPGALLAGAVLYLRSKQFEKESRSILAGCFRWAALGFFIYALTQVFVSPLSIFPARYINSVSFRAFTGIPIQAVRAVVAVLILFNLIRAIQMADKEREEQLLSAQKARLDALEQIRQELETREAMRRELLRHTVIAQEEERSRIARELHDETAQYLTAISLNLATLETSLPKKTEMNELMNRLQNLIRLMSRGLHQLVHDLRPAQLDDLGLVPALQYLAEQDSKRMNLDINVKVAGTRHRLDPLLETVIFRVAQEALANVSRHAKTDRAWINLQFEPEQVILQVRDQGSGFDPSGDLIPPRGWGLAGMRERVESVNGCFQIISGPGKGTLVEAVLPEMERD